MVRLSGHIFSVYTEPGGIDFWQQADIQQWYQNAVRPVDKMAGNLDVRLRFYSGQFCVLADHSDDIVRRHIF